MDLQRDGGGNDDGDGDGDDGNVNHRRAGGLLVAKYRGGHPHRDVDHLQKGRPGDCLDRNDDH